MPSFPIFQVDAFTSRIFGGNPAAVVLLKSWPSDQVMSAIAAENNLSETAFVLENDPLQLRWFTPAIEVDLCGHATLAAGFVMLRSRAPGSTVEFQTREVGTLSVRALGDSRFQMKLPKRAPERVPVPPGVKTALAGQPIKEMWAASKYMAVLEDAQAVQNLAPDMNAIAALDRDGLIVTAPGAAPIDFVSRYFAPHAGIPEDPVTGSAHCVLAPYWADRLEKSSLRARQLSKRQGDLQCTVEGAQVIFEAQAQLYLEGKIHVPKDR